MLTQGHITKVNRFHSGAEITAGVMYHVLDLC